MSGGRGERRFLGRAIWAGEAEGRALAGGAALSFLGGVDPATGVVVEKGHPLEGRSVAGAVLVLPSGKGSTVGSYVIYRMKKEGTAPAAIVMGECDSVIATGAILAEIPCVDRVDVAAIGDGDEVRVASGVVTVRPRREGSGE